MSGATRRRLGLLLSTDPGHPNLETALGLAHAALDRGVECYLYLIDDGVRALDDPRVRALPRAGGRLFVCAYGCRRRGLPLEDTPDVTYCGLVVLGDLLEATDRFVALD